jgi:hypothetical protein
LKKGISTEELNKIVESEEFCDDEFDVERSVELFIKDLGIFPGSNRIPNHVVYYNYRKVWGSQRSKKLGKTNFFREFSKNFDSVRTGKTRYYLLECIKLNFNKDMYKKSKKFNKGDYLKKQHEKESKS